MIICTALGFLNLGFGMTGNRPMNYFASGFCFAIALAIALKTGVI